MRKLSALLVLGLALGLTPVGRSDEKSPDQLARSLYETYLVQRKDKSWGASQRRLTALRSLGPVACERARTSLLKVARTGKGLDDRLLAAQGIARYGDRASIDALLAILAKKGHPVLTQAVGEALAETKDGDVLAWLSDEALALPAGSLPPVLRAHALLAMPESGERLLALYRDWVASPETVDLAFDALQALGRGATSEALAPLLEAAHHTEARIRLAAADVIARQSSEDPKVVAAVETLLDDPQPHVQRAMAEGIAEAKSKAFVPAVTRLLEEEDPRTRKTALDVLKRMTQKDFGLDAGAWRRWWEKRDTPNAPTPYTVPTYHGLPVFTERVVFVLDRSGSMLWPKARGVVTRMEVARDELVKVLQELTPATQFNVISFDTKIYAWQKGETKADAKNVAKAARWVKKQKAEADRFTNTYGALQTAYEKNPTIDTIYFLSDGIPEAGEITTNEGILAAVREWNRYRRVKIHAVALTLMYTHPGKYPITGSMRRAESFMQALAGIGGGRFQHVSRPP